MMPDSGVVSRRWERTKKVFQQAVELPPDARDEYLHRACGGDRDLRAEVDSLLRADAGPAPWFAEPVFEAAAGLLGRDPDLVGNEERIGPYRVLREIGRGGMGTVYLAVRADDEFQQQVAIKLLKRGMDSDELLRRFRQERQILASLDHPNIARLLDGGATPQGRPYFIMEYVEGTPIDAFCDRADLGLVERIALFRQICSAVGHAHRNLVVHRDLKPTNILVTAEGAPKLLDFGVAKLLGSDHVPRLMTATAAGPGPMTPEYASPEQVRGEVITTASDVYSLGVLLYLLLTGGLPYRFESRRPRDIERTILEQAPEKPSQRLGRDSPERGRAAGRRGLLGSRRARFSRELDNIVLMALHKDPGRRYGSVEALDDDLRRCLEGLPVVASGDSLGYRMSKLLGRHKAAVAAALLVLASLIAGIVTTSWQARKARAEQARADRVSEFLVELFRLADPYKLTGGAVSARQLLDEGEKEIRRELGDQPELLATLMDTMAQAYSNLGLYEEAAPLAREALEIRRRVLPPGAAEIAASLDRVGNLSRQGGDYDTADLLFREALEMRRREFGERSVEVAASYEDLAGLRRLQGDYAAAETFYRDTLELRRALLGEDHLQVARTFSNLALLQRDLGRFDEAEKLYRWALDVGIRAAGEKHADVAIYRHNLGELLRNQGNLEAAEELLRQSLALNLELLPPEHPAIATSWSTLALVLQERGAHDEAESLFRRALEHRRNALGEPHRAVANSLNLLGALERERGRLPEARALLEEGLAMRQELLGGEHLVVSYSLVELARLHLAEKDAAGGESLVREALRIQRQSLPEDHWRLAGTRSVLGEILAALGQDDAARALLEQSLGALTERLGAEHHRTREARARLENLGPGL